MTTPFDFLNSINNHVDMWSEELQGSYVPFVINRALSNFPDTLFYANDMNQHAHLSKDLQYYFYLNSVPKGKRFSAWHKPKYADDIKMLSEHYNMSLSKAVIISTILSEDQKNEIIRNNKKGG